ELDNIFLFFPDPWPKKRHHKKRLFSKDFLLLAHHLLKNDGNIYIKTDHDGLFEWMQDVLNAMENTHFSVVLKSYDLWKEHDDHFLASFQTSFEKLFRRKNTTIKALVLKKKDHVSK
ncbi:hypothetical protein OAB57_02060, partial [Bacteriovoracaceae bacterium]|nr:hypothetical protein [Bacteriovoracaceae bacterium]